jgi:hypothetical protein
MEWEGRGVGEMGWEGRGVGEMGGKEEVWVR